MECVFSVICISECDYFGAFLLRCYSCYRGQRPLICLMDVKTHYNIPSRFYFCPFLVRAGGANDHLRRRKSKNKFLVVGTSGAPVSFYVLAMKESFHIELLLVIIRSLKVCFLNKDSLNTFALVVNTEHWRVFSIRPI